MADIRNMFFVVIFCYTAIACQETEIELIDLGYLDDAYCKMQIIHRGNDDVLSYAKIQWIRDYGTDSLELTAEQEIEEVSGIFEIVDISTTHCEDSILVEMSLAGMGVKAYGRLVLRNTHQYEIQIDESNP